MKRVKLLIIILISGSGIFAQEIQNVFNLRSYNKNLTLVIKGQQTAKLVSDEYGKTVSLVNPSNIEINYSYQAQEFDSDLNIYFFPSRIYSAKENRFYQTDPKSQYFSPYLFVGADPINHIDKNGKAGKALFIYAENRTKPGGVENFVKDIRSQAKDVYAVPMSDLADLKVMDLSEFNGNVFIAAHGDNEGDILAETASEQGEIRSGAMGEVFFDPDHFTYSNIMEPHAFGKQLREFADKNKLEVKNIVLGTCQGERSAEELGQGFVQKSVFKPPKFRTSKVRTYGIDKRFNSAWMGNEKLTEMGFAPTGETRMFPLPTSMEESEVSYDIDSSVQPRGLRGYTYKPDRGASPVQQADFATGEEVTNYVQEARIPESLSGYIKSYEFPY